METALEVKGPSLGEGGETTSLRARLAWAIGYPLATLLGWIAITGPRNIVGGKRFMTSLYGVTAGDHVQITYYLWLWWHSLTTLKHWPWTDPYQFAATGHLTHQPFGWPLVLVSLPAQAIFGPVGAFNAVMYGSIVAAAGATFLWARSLHLPRLAAAVAGFAFAFTPFRLSQRFHFNFYIGFLLPLCLYGAERALRGEDRGARLAGWLCTASFLSLTASGEMHVVVYFAPVLAAYILFRAWGVGWDRIRMLLPQAAVLAIGSLLFLGLTYKVVFIPSSRAGKDQAGVPAIYAPRIPDLVRRGSPTERTAYPGAMTFALAALGGIVWLRRPDREDRKALLSFFVVIGAGAVLLALLPGWGTIGLRLYNDIKVLHRILDPGRIMIVPMLLIAVLAGAGFNAIRVRHRPAQALLALLVVGIILFDSSALTRNISASTAEPNLSPAIPRGASVLDLPPFNAGHFLGSRYTWQMIQDPGPHVGGYSIFVTPAAEQAMHAADHLADVPPDPCTWRDASRILKFRYVAVHRALFGNDQPNKWTKSDGEQLVNALNLMHGLERISIVRDVVTYRFTPTDLRCSTP